MKKLLSENERKAIAGLISEVESKTSGEIVAVITGRSDSYPGARWRIAISFAILIAFAAIWIFPEWAPVWYLWLEFAALGVGYALGSIKTVERIFLSDAKMEEEVHQRALQAFLENGLNETENRTGVLIFISLLEHRVEILADSGINSVVEKDQWEKTVGALISSIRAGKLGEGLLQAVRSCGGILEKAFPSQGPKKNELSNHLIILEN